MKRDAAKAKALESSGEILPLVLAAAFVFSYLNELGTALILAISTWYLLLNWRAVLKSRWALIVIGFFAAIALKDAAMFLAGAGGFKAFAKSGSRVFVLAGSAALLFSYSRERLEASFAAALAATAAAMTLYWLLLIAHYRLGWPALFAETLQRNVPGQLSLWLPLAALVAVLKKRGEDRSGGRAARQASIRGWLVFIAGEILLLVLALNGGWRVGPIAFPCLALMVALDGRIRFRASSWILYILSLLSLFLIVAIGSERINDLLFYRPDLWRGYMAKAAERFLVGWGYTDGGDNKRILGEALRGTKAFAEFAEVGLGPHNSYIAMLFENGIAALAGFVALMGTRILSTRSDEGVGFFDLSFAAFIFLLSTDAMNPGGLRFLGYFLSFCLLAKETGTGTALRRSAFKEKYDDEDGKES